MTTESRANPEPTTTGPTGTAGDGAAHPASSTPTAEVVFYARPGCPFCTMLRSALHRTGLAYREVDIWQDPSAAAAVRAAANGNETVPTINVGDTWLVNPSAQAVLAAVRAEAPELLPAEPTGKPGLLGRVFGKGD